MSNWPPTEAQWQHYLDEQRADRRRGIVQLGVLLLGLVALVWLVSNATADQFLEVLVVAGVLALLFFLHFSGHNGPK
jgi:hypothetical protein